MSTGLAFAAGVGAVVSLAVGVTALFVSVPVPLVALLGLVVVPVGLVGQLWVIRLITKRPRPDGERPFCTVRALFGELPGPGVGAVLAGFGVGWLLAVSGLVGLATQPSGPTYTSRPHCAHPVDDHGTYTCASAAEHRTRVRAGERMFLGLASGFLCVHCGGALGDPRRRRLTPRG